MSKLFTHKHYLPSFGILAEDQVPVCLYTILSVNESAGDCAAYQGIGPTMSGATEDEINAMMERIKAGGSKISERDARQLFDEIETLGLRYRL